MQMGEWMWGEEEREARWSGEVEQGTSREGDRDTGGVSEDCRVGMGVGSILTPLCAALVYLYLKTFQWQN